MGLRTAEQYKESLRDGRLEMLFGKIDALIALVVVMVVALFAADTVASTAVALIDGKSLRGFDLATLNADLAALG